MKAMTEAGLASDVGAAYNWVKNNSDVGDNIACIGYCMGGRAAFFTNTELPVKAAVSYYGGNIPIFLGRVQQLSAPMLFFWGELDHHISPEQRSQVTTAMREAKKEYIDVVFSNADHGFFCDVRTSYEPHAARLAWDMTISFLDARLQ
jgi:carboxymethylenebutenolidase